MAKKKGKRSQGCRECGFLARHPFCCFCTKKAHWIGGLVDNGKDGVDIDRNAPARKIEDPLVIAYLLPYMVEGGQLPREALQRVTKQVLGKNADKITDSGVWGFHFGKHPYRFKVVQADVTGDITPYVKVRYAGWNCRFHRGALPADAPATVLRRDEMSCVVCGSKKGLGVTYIVPPKEQGTVSVGNLATFCGTCVERRGDMDYWTFLRNNGVPIDELIVDFKTGFVRSILHGNTIEI
jgi:hypothetical protein